MTFHDLMRRRSAKSSRDFYPTPEVATRALLRMERFAGPVWEPACGRGHISRVLMESGLKVHSTDAVDRGFGRGGVDLLDRPAVRFSFEDIVTNPPYKIGLEFAEAALSYRPRKMALLLRMMWLETPKRAKFFEDSHLARVLVFSSRISMSKKHKNGRGGFVPYCWYIWVRGYRGEPTIRFIYGDEYK